MLRTTTRVNHCRGPVSLGELPKDAPKGTFEKDPFNLVVVPMVGRKLRVALLEKVAKLQEEAERSPLNVTVGQGKWGIVTSGVSYLYVRDAVRDLGIEDRVKILKLGFSFPHPKALIADFLGGLEKVLVVEELEPFLEETVRVVAQESGLTVDVGGKGAQLVPRAFELDVVKVKRAVGHFFHVDYEPPVVFAAPELPQRPPNLCPGCPHRATFYSVKKAFGEEAVYPTDIGCYTLGLLPPLQMADFLICMGSSVSTAGGFSKVLDRPVVAFIGDSTFFHAGLPGIINAIFNKHNITLILMENGTTAMTGHQDHAACGRNFNDMTDRIPVRQVLEGLGVKKIYEVDTYQQVKLSELVKTAIGDETFSVVIARHPCMLKFTREQRRKKDFRLRQVAIDQEKCDRKQVCIEAFACPTFTRLAGGQIEINRDLCIGDGSCLKTCPSSAIKTLKTVVES